MTAHKGKARRIYNNATMKRPSEKNRRKKAKIKLHNTRHQSDLKAESIHRQNQKEYSYA